MAVISHTSRSGTVWALAGRPRFAGTVAGTSFLGGRPRRFFGGSELGSAGVASAAWSSGGRPRRRPGSSPVAGGSGAGGAGAGAGAGGAAGAGFGSTRRAVSTASRSGSCRGTGAGGGGTGRGGRGGGACATGAFRAFWALELALRRLVPGRCGGGGVPAGAVFSTPPGEGASLLAKASRTPRSAFLPGRQRCWFTPHIAMLMRLWGSRWLGSPAVSAAHCTAITSVRLFAELKRFRSLFSPSMCLWSPPACLPKRLAVMMIVALRSC